MPKDIILQDNGELLIDSGDFSIGESTNQQQAILLIANEGEFKTNPSLGIGIGNLLLGEELLEYRHKIREHYRRDGLKIKKLDLYEIGKLNIDVELDQEP